MKTIGLLGGMSWESTALYYRWINEGIKARLGGLHSAEIVLRSVDFAAVERLQAAGDWDGAGRLLAAAAREVQAAGADFLLLCTNTMHIVAPQIAAALDIPLLHLADATAAQIKAQGCDTVGLLGTRFTMEQDFYAGRLRDQHGLTVLVPPPAARQMVHDIIYDELVLGQIKPQSRAAMLEIMADLHGRGAQGIIEGCTEIVLLVQQEHTPIPLFDTTAIHAAAAVAWSLAA